MTPEQEEREKRHKLIEDIFTCSASPASGRVLGWTEPIYQYLLT